MRKVYLLVYDLKKPGQNYTELIQTLKTAEKWWHYLKSTWLLASDLPFETWHQNIKSKIDQNDSFMLMELQPGMRYDGWLPQEAWDWMRENLGGWIGPPILR